MLIMTQPNLSFDYVIARACTRVNAACLTTSLWQWTQHMPWNVDRDIDRLSMYAPTALVMLAIAVLRMGMPSTVSLGKLALAADGAKNTLGHQFRYGIGIASTSGKDHLSVNFVILFSAARNSLHAVYIVYIMTLTKATFCSFALA